MQNSFIDVVLIAHVSPAGIHQPIFINFSLTIVYYMSDLISKGNKNASIKILKIYFSPGDIIEPTNNTTLMHNIIFNENVELSK